MGLAAAVMDWEAAAMGWAAAAAAAGSGMLPERTQQPQRHSRPILRQTARPSRSWP